MVLLENQELVLIGGASDGSVQGLGVPWGSWANPSPRNLSERANGLCNSSHKLHYFVGAEQRLTDKDRSHLGKPGLLSNLFNVFFYINLTNFLLNLLFFFCFGAIGMLLIPRLAPLL